jgi:hypothetical protein
LANLKANNSDDIPFATQRSDSWNLADMYKAYTGKACEVPGQLGRAEKGELKKALKAEDLRRRLHQAQAIIDKASPQTDK